MDFTTKSLSRHRVDDRGAEAPPLRRSHRWAVALSPTHREGVTVKPPAHVNTAGVCRECPVFAGIGRKLMQCEPDGLRCGCVQMQLRTVHGDPRPDKIRKMREVSAYQVLQIGSLPLVPTQQVLVGGERLDALRESPDKVLNITSRDLAAIACTRLSRFLTRWLASRIRR